VGVEERRRHEAEGESGALGEAVWSEAEAHAAIG
jgi:hypothetical protein